MSPPPKVNVRQCIRSAIAAKSPIVGIPQPGGPPVCFERLRLSRALRGVRIYDARIIRGGQWDPPNVRYLAVTGRAGLNVHVSFKMRALDLWWKSRERNGNWAETQRKRGSTARDKLAGRITKLRWEIGRYHSGALRELLPPSRTYGQWERSEVQTWYEQRRLRRTFRSKDSLAYHSFNNRAGDKAILHSKPWALKPTLHVQGPERYWFLKDAEYRELTEELRGLLSVKAEREDRIAC